jgi:glucose/mannose-6-phosphate isomerase
MLDDQNVIAQRDPHGALAVAAAQWSQAAYDAQVIDADNDGREITRVVVTGMGGSALAALLLKAWKDPELRVPFEVARSYDLPKYVDSQTLVIASSYSGNTEETLSGLQQARERFCQVGVISSGGHLKEIAEHQSVAHVVLPGDLQPRMAMLYNLRALVALLINFGVLPASTLDEIADVSDWLRMETQNWLATVTTDKNDAKQLALLAVGKTPVFYGGPLTAPIAYKWKISWNENAKNVAFWNQYPEFNHNEFIGWTSHPVEKPFAVFDIISHLEHPQVLKRFAVSDKLLSGVRPKAQPVHLKGDTVIAQMLWGCVLADFVSIYVALLNGVDPVPVPLIEKLKTELA